VARVRARDRRARPLGPPLPEGLRQRGAGRRVPAQRSAARRDLPFLREQLLDAWGIDYGILNCLHGGGGQLNARWGAAQCQAVNDWQVAEWLDPEPRLRASIVVHPGDPEAAAREVARCARDRRFVQVLLTVRTAEPLGKPRYWLLYAAAAEHGLPVGIHFGGPAPNPITPTGWPSYYLEDHSGMMLAFQAQVASFVYEGAFQRFPDLRVVLIEGGFAWLPSTVWRLDKNWKGLRQEVPWVERLPSEYVREQVRLTTHPLETTEPADLADTIRLVGPECLLWGSNYPRYDAAPRDAFPAGLPAEVVERLLGGNARETYRVAAPA
jgi:uncharacterized protein